MDAATADLGDLNLNANDEEDTEEEENEEADDQVLLAFLEDPDEPEELQRHRFPHKAGGAPAWLDPVALPAGDARLCGFCGEPLRFALQVYAPLPPVEEDDEDAAYHRSLFVFMCPAMACLLLDQHEQMAEVSGAGGPPRPPRSVMVFRCQLPRENAFYCYEDDTGDGEARWAASGVEVAPLCDWCGTWRTETACAGCAATAAPRMFCSEKHLERHLRSGHGNRGERAPSASATWSEYAMSTEEEKTPSTAAQEQGVDGGGGDEQENAADDDHDDEEAAAAAVDDALMGAFEAAEDEDTARWATFQARMSADSDQVLRYCAGGRPLWAAATGSLTGAAPACGRCGAARRYEMQLMPQLLHYLRVEVRDPDPLDWATIAVYTCTNSCGGGGYVEEFAWVQLHPARRGCHGVTAMDEQSKSDSCSRVEAMHDVESSDDEG
ncbi:unnamed protein product [Urochloa humidicola]